MGCFHFNNSSRSLFFLGTWKLYKAAGEAPWKAIVPIYNAIILFKIINRPRWWVLAIFTGHQSDDVYGDMD